MGMFSSHVTPCRNLCSAFSTMWELLRDGLQFLRTIFTFAGGFGRRDLVPAKAARLLPRPSDPTAPTPRRLPVVPVVLVSPVRLVGSARGRQDEYFYSLASQRFQVVLAMEVARWPPIAPERDSAAHRSYGRRKRDLGRGAHR